MKNAEILDTQERLSGETSEYISLGGHFSTLDGIFSADELRAVARAMDAIKADPCEDCPERNEVERR